ncbi:MAG: hypothetical protein LBQ01_04935 [Prevotellaceae bacterium]|jgi:hypothetical protein|nr:hypothetical protein [Prevotellaceae bacterium]
MKRVLSVILVLVSFGVFAQPKEKDVELKEQAATIKKELALDDKSEHLVYNVLYHVKTRIADIPLGHGNYQKLVSYVDEERVSMMKALLPANKYKQYESVFGPGEKQKIASILAKNAEYVKNHGVLAKKITLADMDDKFTKETEDNEDENTVVNDTVVSASEQKGNNK